MIDGFTKTEPTAFEIDADPVIICQKQIDQLVAAARTLPRGRARLLLHPSRQDSLQEMVIVLPPNSCDHPHINSRSGKSFLALSGQFAVIRCADDGTSFQPIILSAGPWRGERLVRLRKPAWHTIIPLAGDIVFLETIVGPFVGNRFAPWFPETDDKVPRGAFEDRLRRIARESAAALEN